MLTAEMTENKNLKFDKLTDVLKFKNNNESMIIHRLNSYFYPKILKNGFHYIIFGCKILKKILLAENSECVIAAERMLTFIKRQVKKVIKEALEHHISRERTWKCLTNLWEYTKSLVDMDSDVDFSEFGTWLLKSIIDFGAETKLFLSPGRVFSIEENISYADDKFSNSSSLDVAMKLKSVLEPKSRKYKEVIYPITSYVFKYHCKTHDIEKFLRIALLAKIIFQKSAGGSSKAKSLLEVFLKKATLPSDYFAWAEHHLQMKKPKGKKLQREKIFLHILTHLNCSLVYSLLCNKNNETKKLNKKLIKSTEVLESEGKLNIDKNLVNTLCQKNLKDIAENSSVVCSASGPFQILMDKNFQFKNNSFKRLPVNMTKFEVKSKVNSKSDFTSRRKNSHKLDRRSDDKSELVDNFSSNFRKLLATNKNESVNCNKLSEKKASKKRKRRHQKNKSLIPGEDCEEPSSKKEKLLNLDSSSTLQTTIANSGKNLIGLPSKGRSVINPKKAKTKVRHRNVNKVESKESLSANSKLQKAKNGQQNIPKDNITKKHDYKSKQEESSALKFAGGSETDDLIMPNVQNVKKSLDVSKMNETDQKHIFVTDYVKKRNDKRKRDESSLFKLPKSSSLSSENCGKKIDVLLSLDLSKEVFKSDKKRRRKAKHNNNEKNHMQQVSTRNKTEEASQKNNKVKPSDIKVIQKKETFVKRSKNERESDVDEASGSDSDIVPNDLENPMFTKEETRAYHQLQLKELKKDKRRQKMNLILGKAFNPGNSISSGNLEADREKDEKSKSEASVSRQDLDLSLFYRNKMKMNKTETTANESDPYGDDDIEDLKIVFSTIRKDLKNKFDIEIKKELPSKEDPIPIKSTNYTYSSGCHPDNVFNIYSKKSIRKPIIDKNERLTVNFDDPIIVKHICPNDKNVNSFETNTTVSQTESNNIVNVTLKKNEPSIHNGDIIEDFDKRILNSLNEATNIQLCCNDDKLKQGYVLSEKDVDRIVEVESTIEKVKTVNNLKSTINEPSIEVKKNKELSNINCGDLEDSDKYLTLTLDESSEDSFTDKDLNMSEIGGSSVNTKLISDAALGSEFISQNESNEIVKGNLEISTSEFIDSTRENTLQISEIIVEQKCTEGNVDEKINKNFDFAETEPPGCQIESSIFEKESDATIEREIDRFSEKNLRQNSETSISENVDNENESSNNLISDVISKEILEEERPSKESQSAELSFRKALTFDAFESSEQGSEISVLDGTIKSQEQNIENSENKENIVNNKQEEITKLSFDSNISVEKESSNDENHTQIISDSPKIKESKFKSPVKRKLILENSISPKDVISLTPLKVASAALSNEIIISPDVSDEENTARAIRTQIEEENIIFSSSESNTILSQEFYEEEQIRDENEQINSYDFISSRDKSLTQVRENFKNEIFTNSSSSEVSELISELTTTPQSKQSPKLALSVSSSSVVLQKRETPKIIVSPTSTNMSDVKKKSPLVITEKLIQVSEGCTNNQNIEESTVCSKIVKNSIDSCDNVESKSELVHSNESEEELECKDKVPSPVRTRYSLRKTRITTTPEKEVRFVRSRRNSVSSVKSENEVDIGKLCSPSTKSKRSLIVGNLTPVRRSRRISGLSHDKI